MKVPFTLSPSKFSSGHFLVWLLPLLLGLYALLPQVLAPVVSIEGFEAAVTSYVNQKHLFHATTLLPPYGFGNRPGEFYLYGALVSLLHIDALYVGQALSLLSFLIGGWCTVILARRTGYGDAFSATLSYVLLFNLSATAAQVTSTNLAMALLMAAMCQFTRTQVWRTALGGVLLSLAIFCRLDSVIFLPFPPLVMWLARQPVRTALIRGLWVTAGALFAAVVLYRLSGLMLFDELFGGNASASWLLSGGPTDHLLSVLLPYTGLLALIGIASDIYETKNRPYEVAGRVLLAILPILLVVLAYKSKLETPRFLTSASPLLALAACRGIMFLKSLTNWRRLLVWSAILLLTVFCYLTRTPLFTWDGFRYQRASFTTPYEIYRLKNYLGATYSHLEEQIFELESDATQNRPASIVSTSWQQYNQIIRSLILRGGIIEDWENTSLGGSPPLAVPLSAWRIGDKRYRMYLFERGREFNSPTDLARALQSLPLDGPHFSLIAARELSDAVIGICPGAIMTVIGEYDRFDINSSHWIRFSGSQCSRIYKLPTSLPWKAMPHNAMFDNYALMSSNPGDALKFSTGKCFDLKFLKHDWSGIVKVLKDGVLIREIDLFSKVQDPTYKEFFSQDLRTHIYTLEVSDKKNPASHSTEIWVDAVLERQNCEQAVGK